MGEVPLYSGGLLPVGVRLVHIWYEVRSGPSTRPIHSSSSLLLSSLELSDTPIFEPSVRALLGTASHFCEVVGKTLLQAMVWVVRGVQRSPKRAPFQRSPKRARVPLNGSEEPFSSERFRGVPNTGTFGTTLNPSTLRGVGDGPGQSKQIAAASVVLT